MLTLLSKGVPTKLLKFFWLKIFFICHRCRWHRWSTLSCEYLRDFWKKFEMVLMGLGGNWFIKKTRSKKSRDTVPLNNQSWRTYRQLWLGWGSGTSEIYKTTARKACAYINMFTLRLLVYKCVHLARAVRIWQSNLKSVWQSGRHHASLLHSSVRSQKR
jgi:hypothetical protein